MYVAAAQQTVSATCRTKRSKACTTCLSRYIAQAPTRSYVPCHSTVMTSPNGSIDGSQTPGSSCTTGSNDGDLQPSIAAIPSVSPSISQASILRSVSSPGSHLRFVLPESVATSSQIFITASDPSAPGGTASPRVPNSRGLSGAPLRNSRQASRDYHHTVLRRPISDPHVSSIRRAWQSTKANGDIEKPWLKHVDPAHRWAKVVFWVLFVLGITGACARMSVTLHC